MSPVGDLPIGPLRVGKCRPYHERVALRRMRARGRGTIVQVGSALAYRAIPLKSTYCGAKHAIRAASLTACAPS
jgi:NADP-dependent 3-hydroxy acid dehydrogenase YdfG